MNPVSVRVPGSTSNCGAGFDTLGMAVQLYNTVTLSPAEGREAKPESDSDGRAAAMVAEVGREFLAVTGVETPGFTYRIEGDVPSSRGLGSSVTVLAGVLGGLNHWAGNALTDRDMAKVLTRIEGHPDNATAGVWGGFCVTLCGETAAEFRETIRIEVPAELKFVVVSPDLEISTKSSRGVLPASISHVDATRSINSAAFISAAMAKGDFSKLQGAVSDFMHEPYRLPGIPGGAEAIAAGIQAGGFTGWLSGSGSSVLCVAEGANATNVEAAMRAAFAAEGSASSGQILSADNNGMRIVSD